MTAPQRPTASASLESVVRFCRASGHTGPALLGYVRQIARQARLAVVTGALEALVDTYSAASICEGCTGRGFRLPQPAAPTMPYGDAVGCEACAGEGWVGLVHQSATP